MKLRKSVFAAIAATLLIAVSMQAKDEMKRIYIFGFALVGLYWGSTREIELLQQASLNAYVLCTLAGFIQGTAVLSKLTRNRLSRWIFWMIIVFVFVNGTISQLVSIFGLFDILLDYRRRFSR